MSWISAAGRGDSLGGVRVDTPSRTGPLSLGISSSHLGSGLRTWALRP